MIEFRQNRRCSGCGTFEPFRGYAFAFSGIITPQTESNRIRLNQTIPSEETGADMVLKARVTEGLKMGRFEETLLDR